MSLESASVCTEEFENEIDIAVWSAQTSVIRSYLRLRPDALIRPPLTQHTWDSNRQWLSYIVGNVATVMIKDDISGFAALILIFFFLTLKEIVSPVHQFWYISM